MQEESLRNINYFGRIIYEKAADVFLRNDLPATILLIFIPVYNSFTKICFRSFFWIHIVKSVHEQINNYRCENYYKDCCNN